MIANLEEHEAFLRAIFAAPADDTPRLVYADFLDENGEPERATFIRLECESARCSDEEARRREMLAALEDLRRSQRVGWPYAYPETRRGFPLPTQIAFTARDLADPLALRERAVRDCPDWFATPSVRIWPPARLGPEQVEALFALPFLQQATDWQLGGFVDEVPSRSDADSAGMFALIDLTVEPAITVHGVETLANHRGARRIETLVLTNNNLDNDAARALARSPHLIRLKKLDLFEGNRFRGRVWQELIGRFGEEVVG